LYGESSPVARNEDQAVEMLYGNLQKLK